MDAKKHPKSRYKFAACRERLLVPDVANWGVVNARSAEKFVR